MRRFLVLILLLGGCSTGWNPEDDPLRVTPREGGVEISLRRNGAWVPLLLVEGAGAPTRDANDGRLRFAVDTELRVELLGRKSMALFPGLEFLEGEEPSSSERDARGLLADRRRPEAWKITVPLMAFESGGALVSLMWEPGPELHPFFEARERNRMALTSAASFHATLLVEPGATIYDAVPRWIETYGLPAPADWPRSPEEELALCKSGFAAVAAPRGKHRHAAGPEWPADWSPGFGVLLHLLGETVDWFDYSDLLSTANCHLLRWEAPFYAGEPELVKKLSERLKILTDMRQTKTGEWGFHPFTDAQRKLGPAGETVLGTSAQNAMSVAKAARMTGDETLKAVALDVLARLRRHRVPRGGQNLECPLFEPDLLSAAFAVAGNLEALKLGGGPEYLAEAVRWAKAGLPFLFLWNPPDRPALRYASVPVFGTSQFTQPWFGVPAQWTGLIYAYALRRLAPLDRSVDWMQVADGITASGVLQQYPDGPSKGCLPSALADQGTRRLAPDLNPEELLANLLAAMGKDPDPDLSLKKK